MRFGIGILVMLINLLPKFISAQSENTVKSAYTYSLRELSELEVFTGSVHAESAESAPFNIVVITGRMLEERGYRTLVDICQDIPGFDFMMYNDGGGEYPTYNMHRGMGEIGNSEILLMIDGIVQNNISFNWSLLWTYDNLFIDVDRLEIIQGPGSVVYGAQAFSGVINIITKKNYHGTKVTVTNGVNQTFGSDIHIGSSLGKNTHLSLACHKYKSTGDYGIERYDPAEYFKNNRYPQTILADYDSAGNYVENTINPKGGQIMPGGFNTLNNSYSVRAKISYKETEGGFFLSNAVQGYSSANVGYEYNVFERENVANFKSYYSYLKNKIMPGEKTELTSSIVFRGTHILPSRGFRYLYRFNDLAKSYIAYSYQGYFEEHFIYNADKNNIFSLGIKGALSRKNERVVSLGEVPETGSTATSSWDIAVEGGGLDRPKKYPVFWVKEAAVFAIWDKKWSAYTSSSLGVRYDLSSEYKSIVNPRIALDYNPKPFWGLKLMYGTAFRQPSIFELTSEFRGNSGLVPQKIGTTELEVNSLLLRDRCSLKFNVFYSKVSQQIGKVEDSTKPAGERFENIQESRISGISLFFSLQFYENARFYSNYSFLTGIEREPFRFYPIDRTAGHKINAGINQSLFERKLSVDLRSNYVGKRKAPVTNVWMQKYEGGWGAPYLKFNLVVSYRFAKKFTAQIIINNLFNEQYYGMGRETGSGFIDEYDYVNNVNPEGHIPAYHPQPGRTYFFRLIFKFDENG